MKNTELRMRLGWVELYEETKDAGFVCRRCGISRPTLRKWCRRYKEHGIKGLESQSKKPKHSPRQKIFQEQENWILTLRKEMNIGARRIQNELIRQYDYHLSLASIQKVLQRNKVEPIQKPRRKKKHKRYQKEVPGERIQMDTCKIRPGMYQFTAVDDCTFTHEERLKTLCYFWIRCAKKCLSQSNEYKQTVVQNSLPTRSRRD